jgi:hypothetical protein
MKTSTLVLVAAMFACTDRRRPADVDAKNAKSPNVSATTPSDSSTAATPATSTASTTKLPLRGYNQNWSFLPALSSTLVEHAKSLRPQVLRYPGGTVTHSWDWKAGSIRTRGQGVPHALGDIAVLSKATQAAFIFVVDIVNSSLDDQLQMLRKIQDLGVAIDYVELGNELYAPEYESSFPTGREYGVKATQWANAIRAQFPSAKTSAVLLGRSTQPSNARMFQWNELVVANAATDAFTYHIYINEKATFAETSANFSAVTARANTGNKPLWISEYGNKHEETEADYLVELERLADFVEGFPNVTLALSHLLVGPNKNKITTDGSKLTPEGQMFVARRQKQSATAP